MLESESIWETNCGTTALWTGPVLISWRLRFSWDCYLGGAARPHLAELRTKVQRSLAHWYGDVGIVASGLLCQFKEDCIVGWNVAHLNRIVLMLDWGAFTNSKYIIGFTILKITCSVWMRWRWMEIWATRRLLYHPLLIPWIHLLTCPILHSPDFWAMYYMCDIQQTSSSTLWCNSSNSLICLQIGLKSNPQSPPTP